ncbi:MAG: hypothetical protein KAV44_06265 [Bacteroidales bacterium]|jgi:hypothetical protein|nr:hypothetical protein [Bacteroidales bacterium]
MLPKIPRSYSKSFNEIITLGSFSPDLLFIRLGSLSSDFVLLDSSSVNKTFNHEFGHLRHYLSSYLGIKDFYYWTLILDVLLTDYPDLTPEEENTFQSNKILEIVRQKQILSIDDEFYFEKKQELFDEAKIKWRTWHVNSVFGKLYTSKGNISDHCFWGSRFFIGPSDDGRTFIRIPIGMRTVLEHMATAIDFIGSISNNTILSDIDQFVSNAYSPELLHYYCLTHWIGPIMKMKYGHVNNAYFVSGQLVSLLCEIPFDDSNIWSKLIEYAKKSDPELVPLMNYPHPSFLFPIIKSAAFNCDINWETFDLTKFEERIEIVLKKLKLPTLSVLRKKTLELTRELVKILNKHDFTSPISDLIKWVQGHENQIGWNARFTNPINFNLDNLPVPIIFSDDSFIEGNIIKMSDSLELLTAFNRKEEMLRYNYSRNIIDE